MAETLFIRLGSQAHHSIHWLIASQSSGKALEIIASGELANAEQLNTLTDKANQRIVKIIVPSSDVLLKRLQVPAKSNRAMRLAVPYMLEDELAQDVEQLFFAYAQNHKDAENNNCFTAIVSHQQMQEWLAWLAAADIETKVFLPEVLSMPQGKGWSAITLGEGTEQQVIVRQGEWQGFTLDLATWQMQCMAFAQQKEIEDDSDDEQSVLIQSYSALPNSEQLAIEQMPEELPLELMAKHYHSNFNLLQNEYKIKDARGPSIKQWYWVAAVALFALLLNVSFKGAQLWQLNAKQELVEAQIISEYKKTFPKTKRVRISTIKSQLNQKLAQLGGANNSAGFLAMLAKITPAFTQVPALKPESLKFDGKRQELRLQAIANNYQTFEQFKAALEQEGLIVKQGAQNNQGDEVTGSFSIRNGGKKASSNKSMASTKTASRGASK